MSWCNGVHIPLSRERLGFEPPGIDLFALVVKLVDTLVLEASAYGRESSSLSQGTICRDDGIGSHARLKI